jgi:hypothetical protein
MAKKKLYTEYIAISATKEMREIILKLCEEQELSISEWVRSAIDLKLQQEPDNDNGPTIKWGGIAI